MIDKNLVVKKIEHILTLIEGGFLISEGKASDFLSHIADEMNELVIAINEGNYDAV